MSYAIIEFLGKQYHVREKELLELPHQKVSVGQRLDVEKVILFAPDDGEVLIGNPTLDKAKVTLKAVEQSKGKKIRVFKYHSKKNYRRTKGYRDKITVVQVEKIAIKGAKKPEKAQEGLEIEAESKEE